MPQIFTLPRKKRKKKYPPQTGVIFIPQKFNPEERVEQRNLDADTNQKEVGTKEVINPSPNPERF